MPQPEGRYLQRKIPNDATKMCCNENLMQPNNFLKNKGKSIICSLCYKLEEFLQGPYFVILPWKKLIEGHFSEPQTRKEKLVIRYHSFSIISSIK